MNQEKRRQRWTTLMALFTLVLFGCGADGESAEASGDEGGSEVQQRAASGGDCGATAIAWNENGEGDLGFSYTEGWAESYAMGDATGYQVMLLNHPRSEHNRFGEPTGDQQRLIISLNAKPGSELSAGTYQIKGTAEADEAGANYIIGLHTADNIYAPTVVDNKSVGTVTINEIDDDHMCGSVDITAPSGTTIAGTFDVPVEDGMGF